MIDNDTPLYNDLYAAIGKFCVEFEQLCFEMQNTIMTILDKEGIQNTDVLRILLAGDTAEPLRQKLLSLVSETVRLNDQEKRIVKNIFGRMQELINSRNDIIHATWFIGWIKEPIELASSARGQKYGKNREGANTKEFNFKVSDFNKLTEKAISIKSLIIRLKVCLSADYGIENNFVFTEKKITVPTVKPTK